MSISHLGMVRVLSLLTFALIGPIASKSPEANSLDREMLDKNRSLSFTLRWKKIRIAEMLFSIAGENDEYWSIFGRTVGPLRLVKDYKGEARQRYDPNGHKYRLEGRDQGFLENREILFRSDELPLVSEFVDRTAEISLTPELSWGRIAISPMGLFRRVMNSTRSPSLCSGSVVVYDGKRAYTVKLDGSRTQERDLHLLDLSEFRERIFWKCSATFDSSTLIQTSMGSGSESKETLKELSKGERLDNEISSDLKWSRVWLFGSKDRRIDFILSANCATFELVGLLISSPLGRIIGKPPSSCEATE